ncbi:MAG: peptide-methionine (S)-S-oxide reductase MsrA [Cyclobacteriaceae bacterium]
MKNLFTSFFMAALLSCQAISNEKPAPAYYHLSDQENLETATLAGGCFWCVEAALEQLVGVSEVVSGYSGGKASTADYRSVSSGKTGHAEAIQVYFDPKIISYEQLLNVFFVAHDPTQLNRQGPDFGPQYRTAIFYHSEEQKETSEKVMEAIQGNYKSPIVTELNAFETFYLAEEYHQNYEKRNPYQPYILRVSKPKVERVQKTFPQLLKERD